MKDTVNKNNFWRRKTKTTLLFLVVFSFCLFVLSLLMTPVRLTHEQNLKTELIHKHQELLSLTDAILRQRMLQMSRDVRFLSSLGPWIPETGQEAVSGDSLLARFFLQMIELNPTYDQIRLLRATGAEVLRVNRTQEGGELVRSDMLQDKAARYYVAEANAVPPGNVYFSPLDLNVEHGEIEKPLKPVIRVASRTTGSHPDGPMLLIINFDANALLRQLRELFGIGAQQLSMMVDSKGYWIIGPDQSVEWGEQLGNPQNRLSEYEPGLWQWISAGRAGVFETGNGTYVVHTVYPQSDVPNPDIMTQTDSAHWHLITYLDQYAWRSKSFVEGQAGQLTVLILIGLSILVSLSMTLYLRIRFNPEGPAPELSEGEKPRQ